jgi:preprotein translocase subunit SecG
MNQDHSHLAVFVAWAGLLAGFLTPVAIVLTIIFTGVNIVMSIRRDRREERLAALEAGLRQPERPQ